jgi:hypothetical protein
MYRDRYRDSAKKVDEGSMWYVAFYSYTIGSSEKTNLVVLLIRSRWFEIDDIRASICQAILTSSCQICQTFSSIPNCDGMSKPLPCVPHTVAEAVAV